MTAIQIAGLVLAGGRGSRLGVPIPKPLVEIAGRPMIAYVLDRFPAAVSPIIIGANDADAFAGLQVPVVPDRLEGFRGPLAALDAAAAWLRERRDPATHLLCLPGDTPFLPSDVSARLTAGARDRPRLARSGKRVHPTVALWPLRALDALAEHIAESGDLSVVRFAALSGFEPIDFVASSHAPGGDAFFNVNTPGDLMRASQALDAG